MVVVVDVFVVVDCFCDGLIECDVDIFDCVVIVDMCVVMCFDFEIDQIVLCDLVEYMVEKWYVGGQFLLVGVVEIEFYMDLCFVGIVNDFCYMYGNFLIEFDVNGD